MTLASTRRAWVAAFVGALSLATAAQARPPSPAACPRLGAVYAAHPASSGGLSYRLQIEALPRSDPGAAVAERWRFQVLDASSGRKLTELRMDYSCAAGAGPCSVAPPSRPGPAGGYFSEVIQLAKDFTLAAGGGAPYAFVLPGFGQDDWSFPRSEQAMPDLTFLTPERALPDLRSRQVWRLTSCGRGK